MFRHCPSCESKNVVIYENAEGESFCLDCAFTWTQTPEKITVSKKVIQQLAGLKRKGQRRS